MARGIEIPLVADVAPFLKGIDNAADAVEDLADVFDDAGDASEKAGDKVEDAFDDARKKADDAADRVEKSWREAMSEVSDRTRRASKSIDDDFDTATKRAGADMDELGRNADSNAQEMATAFNGELDGIVEYAQEMFSEISEVAGGAWAPVGIAAAAAIGFAMTKLEELAGKVNEAREQGHEWAESFNAEDLAGRIEAVRDAMGDLAGTVRDERKWWELWQDDARTGLDQVVAAADAGLVSLEDFMGAFSNTDPEQRLEALGSLLEEVRAEAERYNEENKNAGWNAAAARAAGAQRDALREVEGVLQEQYDAQRLANAETEAAARAHEAQARELGMTVEQYDAHLEATERAAEAQESFNEALADAADPVSTFEEVLERKNDAERASAEATAAATADATDSWEDYAKDVTVSVDDLIAEWNRQAEEAAKFEESLATIAAAGGQALADELRAKGPEVAGAVAATIAKASPEQQRSAIESHARATGREVTSTMADGVTDRAGEVDDAVRRVIAGVTPPDVEVNVVPTASRSGWERQLQTLVGGITVSANVVMKRLGQAYQ